MEINAEKLKKIEKKQHEIEVAINRLTYNVERLKRVIEAANLWIFDFYSAKEWWKKCCEAIERWKWVTPLSLFVSIIISPYSTL